VPVPSEYSVDFLEQILVRDVLSHPVISLAADQSLGEVRTWLASGEPGSDHQGFPVVDKSGALVGMITRRDLFASSHSPEARVIECVRRPAIFVHETATLREVADRMTQDRIGRMPVVSRTQPDRPIGMISRRDLLHAHQKRLAGATRAEKTFKLRPT
jgi:CBS domain-containing protein